MKDRLLRVHPFDHRIGDARCRSLYGGWRRHIWLGWHYELLPFLRYWVRWPYQLVGCRIGRHNLVAARSRRRGYTMDCLYCEFYRAASEQEQFPLPHDIH